jgi:hypothetical protein
LSRQAKSIEFTDFYWSEAFQPGIVQCRPFTVDSMDHPLKVDGSFD